MPIKIASHLSAKAKLEEEEIVTIDSDRAATQDIRPLRILILNLMPLKKPTELQLLRLLGNSPLQLEVDFCRPVSRVGTHTDNSYLESCYLEFNDIKDKYYDGFIVTGAPVEKLEFEEVEYWPEVVEYFEWARDHAYSVLHYCWGAQAGLYYYYGVAKRMLPQKICGIYPYGLTVRNHPLLRGFDDRYFIPQSRYTSVDDQAVDAFEYLSRLEGIIPAIESAHAVAYARELAPSMRKDQIIVINISGRGDKDCAAIARYRGEDLHE